MLGSRTTVPPGGFRYTQPETGVAIHAYSWNGLLNKVREHRLGNGLPIPANWQTEVELQLCQTLESEGHEALCFESDSHGSAVTQVTVRKCCGGGKPR